MQLVKFPPQQVVTNENGTFSEQTLRSLNALVANVNSVTQFQSGTHVQRVGDSKTAAAIVGSDGSLYVETDRKLAYIALSGQWVYAFGIYSVTQDSIPTDLGANDDRLLLFVSDYAHLLQWDGTGKTFNWAPGDDQSGWIAAFVSSPNPTTGWQACDGSSNVARLGPDGTLTFETVPSTAGSYYRQ